MISNRPIIHNFRIQSPIYRIPQREGLDWLIFAHCASFLKNHPELPPEVQNRETSKIKKIIQRLASTNPRIKFRSTVLSDFTHREWNKMRIFNLSQSSTGAPTSDRFLFFSEVVNDVLMKFYSEETLAPSTLIHVTCTGYVSPSGPQRMIAQKRWGQLTEVIHAYHMGCYASIPALRIALGPLSWKKGTVDVVHTELCTIHLDVSQHSLEQFTIQSLFSDGMIKYSIQNNSEIQPDFGLEIIHLQEEILENSEADMTWRVGDHGMQMTLSRSIPDRISLALNDFLSRLATEAGDTLESLKKEALFAVHPGGPKIVDQVQKHLELSERQVEASNKVLSDCGNMSSATLPHIWKQIVEDPTVASGTKVVSLAFGPGLTIAGALLQKVCRK